MAISPKPRRVIWIAVFLIVLGFAEMGLVVLALELVPLVMPPSILLLAAGLMLLLGKTPVACSAAIILLWIGYAATLYMGFVLYASFVLRILSMGACQSDSFIDNLPSIVFLAVIVLGAVVCGYITRYLNSPAVRQAFGAKD